MGEVERRHKGEISALSVVVYVWGGGNTDFMQEYLKLLVKNKIGNLKFNASLTLEGEATRRSLVSPRQCDLYD